MSVSEYQGFSYHGRKAHIDHLSKTSGRSQEKAEDILDFFIHSFAGYDKKLKPFMSEDEITVWFDSSLKINLSSAALQSVFARDDYVQILEDLKDAGLIKKMRNHYYSEEEGIQLCKRFRMVPKKFTSFNKDRPNIYIQRLYRNAKANKTHMAKEIIGHQVDVLNRDTTYIDAPSELYEALTDDQKRIYDKVNQNDFSEKDFTEKNGRIYYPLQRLPKWLRGYFHLDNEKAVELDVKNMQPLMLCRLVRKRIERVGGKIPRDLLKAERLCEKGIWWDHLQWILGVNNKNKVKDDWSKAVCGMIKESSSTDLSDPDKYRRSKLREEFPTIFAWLDNKKEWSKDHRVAYQILTRYESRVLYQVHQLLIDHDIDYNSIHDAFFVPESLAEGLKEHIEKMLNLSMNEPSEEYDHRKWIDKMPGDIDMKRKLSLRRRSAYGRAKKDPSPERTVEELLKPITKRRWNVEAMFEQEREAMLA